MAQKLKTLLIANIIILSIGSLFVPGLIVADNHTTLKASDCKQSGVSERGPLEGKACKKLKADCPSGDVDPKDDTKCLPLGSNPVALKDNPIVATLNSVVKFLSGLVGVVIVGVIIFGGIQYALAGDKAEAVTAAKKRIVNGVTALLAFLFIFAFLQWLIPGGIFS